MEGNGYGYALVDSNNQDANGDDIVVDPYVDANDYDDIEVDRIDMIGGATVVAPKKYLGYYITYHSGLLEERYNKQKKVKGAEEKNYTIDKFKKDLLKEAMEYFMGKEENPSWNKETLLKNINKDIIETEKNIGKKIVEAVLAGSIDEGVIMGDILFEGDKEWTPIDIWFDYYGANNTPGINIHVGELDEIKGSTREEKEKMLWKNKHKDYKTVMKNGKKAVMRLNEEGATELCPIDALTDEQLENELKYIKDK